MSAAKVSGFILSVGEYFPLHRAENVWCFSLIRTILIINLTASRSAAWKCVLFLKVEIVGGHQRDAPLHTFPFLPAAHQAVFLHYLGGSPNPPDQFPWGEPLWDLGETEEEICPPSADMCRNITLITASPQLWQLDYWQCYKLSIL